MARVIHATEVTAGEHRELQQRYAALLKEHIELCESYLRLLKGQPQFREPAEWPAGSRES